MAVRLVVERAALRVLPARRTAEYEEVPARVSKYAIFTVRGVQYSAPSQLIGHRMMVRLYTGHIECWLGGTRVLERARPTQRDGGRHHPRAIDYRHPIGALKKKPGAFARWVMRDEMFPRAVYRQTWERLRSFYGYKVHVGVDARWKLIRRIEVTPANVDDGKTLGKVLDPSNTRSRLLADRGYDSAANRALLQAQGLGDGIACRVKPGQTARQRLDARNRAINKTRARVEHVFAGLEQLGGKFVRAMTLA